MELVSKSISKEGKKGRKYLPLETRIQLYDEVHRLRKQGLIYKEIQRIIYEKYKIRLFISNICCWVHGKKHPLGNVNKFNDKPSPELNYVIGVILGDGYKCFDGERYRLRLAVVDKEFTEEFARNLTKILKKDKPYKPYWSEKLKQWIIEGKSILLYKFLNKPFEELKQYIEYNKDCVASFLRALFDGEATIHKRKLMLYNTDKELLIYAKYLLEKYFNINTTGPHLKEKAGKVKHFPNGGYESTKNCYYLYVRANSLLNFYKFIGFTIKRKQQRLIEAIKQ